MAAEPGEGARGVAEAFASIRARIAAAAERSGRSPDEIRLIAISKYASQEAVVAAYGAGQREFGESRIQNALPRIDALPADVVWHLVGHLQTNKVNKALGRFDLIHSVDSLDLVRRLSEKSLDRDLRTQVLLQVNCSEEESKTGMAPGDTLAFAEAVRGLGGVVLLGLMTMGPRAGGPEGARSSFRRLAELYGELRALDRPELPLNTLSMGMSGDFEVAVEEGATLLRVGGALFGAGATGSPGLQ